MFFFLVYAPRIQYTSQIKSTTPAQEMRKPVIPTRVGLGNSKSGWLMRTFLGAGATPGGSVNGVVSGSPLAMGVRRHS